MSRLSKNIVYNALGQGLLLVLSFVAVKYVFRRLGSDALGIIYFTQTMSAVLFAVLEMGIGSTTVREVSSHFRDEPDYIHHFIRTGSFLFWCAYALLALVIYALAPVLIHHWVHLQGLDASTATSVLRILGISSISILPRAFYAGILRGLQRFEFTNLIDVGFSGVQQVGTIVVLILGGGLLDIAWWYAACYALSILAYLGTSGRLASWSALAPGFSYAVLKRNFAYASRMASLSLTAMVHSQADRAIVSKLLPLSTFGYYAIAGGAASRGTLLTGAIAQAAFPNFSELFKRGNRDALVSQYRKLQDLICFGTVPIFAAILFATLPLFSYVLNAQAAKMLLWPLTFLCLGYYMNGTLNAPYIVSLAVGKPGIVARLNFYALFAVLPVTFALVYFFGLIGAGLSWVFYHLFAYAYAVPMICSECLRIPAAEWYSHVLRIAALAGGTYGGAWMILSACGGRSILSLLLAYAGASVAFLVGAYWTMGDELRESLLHSFHALRLKLAEAL